MVVILPDVKNGTIKTVVKVVNAYKYLGVWFSNRLSFSHSLESQKAKSKAGIVEILKTFWKLGDVSPIFFDFFKLFHSQIKPILLYGSEIWGMQMDLQTEKALLFALKRLLNVSLKTPNDMVYGKLEEHHYIWMLKLAQYVFGLWWLHTIAEVCNFSPKCITTRRLPLSPFLIGRMFLREPSWKYSAKLVGS